MVQHIDKPELIYSSEGRGAQLARWQFGSANACLTSEARYLGPMVSWNGSVSGYDSSRIGDTHQAYGQLWKVWKANLDLTFKLLIGRPVVFETMVSGLIVFVVSSTDDGSLEATMVKFARKLVATSFHGDAKPNVKHDNITIRTQVHLASVNTELQVARLKCQHRDPLT